MDNRWLTDFFAYTFREALGVYVIILLVILIRIAPSYLYPGLNADIRIQPEPFPDSAAWNTDVLTEARRPPVHWVIFDPNTVSARQLVAFGLDERIATRLVRLRDKGFVFYRPADVLKVYGMDQVWFGKAEPWIRITTVRNNGYAGNTADNSKQRHTIPEKERIRVDVATADSFQLTRIPGIGPVLASRIIRYRELVGGFYGTEQLTEVYGMDRERMKAIEPYIHCTPGHMVFLDLQNASYEELSRHPYVGYQGARAIVRYREAHPGTSLKLSLIRALDSVTIQKIRHYLPAGQGL